MRKLIIVTLFLIFFLAHNAWRTAPDAYAFWWGKAKEDKKAQTAATQVVEAANERLKQRVEELSKGNAELKDKNLRVQAEITGLNRDRTQVLDKLKIITEENAKLKDQIVVLQQAMVALDGKNKQMTDESKQIADDKSKMAGRIKELEKEVQPVREVEDELNKKIKDLDSKLRTQSRKMEEILRDQNSELKKWQDKASQFEKQNLSLQKENKETQVIIDKLQEKQKSLLKEKSELKHTLNDTVGKLADANKQLNRLKNETADMHYNLGVIFQGQTKWNEAIREYEKVLETRPDDGDAHYNLALIYDSIKNDRFKAIQNYEEYLGINPDGENAAKVKERITELNVENKVWGAPGAKNIREKKGRW